jgi:hypothetical protein
MQWALKAAGIQDSWASLRQILTVQRRVTTSLCRTDGRSVHVRKSTVAEPALSVIYNAIGVNALPGGTKKLVCGVEISRYFAAENTGTL